ncbi:22918_t:CDS:2, partial [Racocetra persica]
DRFVDITKNILHQWLDENLPNLIDRVTREVVNSIDRKRKLIAQDYISTSTDKDKNDHKVFTYPSKKIQGKVGETVEVLISYQYLTFSHASTKDIWGSGIYTPVSDLIKVLGHSGAFILPKTSQPDHDLSVILRFLPGCDKYLGSINNGLKSQDYNKFNLSFVIEQVKHLP